MSFPVSPSNGQFVTVNNIQYVYSSSLGAWTRSPIGVSVTKLTASASPPLAPNLTDQWYETTTDILYEYITDGVSNYWVDVWSLGVSGNLSVTNIADTTLKGNVIVDVSQRYNIGSLGGLIANIYVANVIANTTNSSNLTVTSNLTTANLSATALTANTIVGGGVRSTSSASPPSNPVVGDIWYQTTTDIKYRYTNDGTNSYWVDYDSTVIGVNNFTGNLLANTLVPLYSNVDLGTVGLPYGNIYVGNVIASSNIYLGNIITNNITTNASFYSNTIRATATTISSSTNTGALVVNGGVGVAGALYVGGNIVAASNTLSIGTTSGALTVLGGAGISGNLTVGGVAGFNSYISVTSIFETAVFAGGPTGTVNIDAISAPIVYFTSNAAASVTINIRGNSITTLNSILNVGQSTSIALVWQNGPTGYYPSTIQIDGVSIAAANIAWQGGGASPSGGNANSTDVYTFTVVKRNTSQYSILASQTKYQWLG